MSNIDYQQRIDEALDTFGVKKKLFRKRKITTSHLVAMIFSLKPHFNIEYQSRQNTLTVEANNNVVVYDTKTNGNNDILFQYAICDAYLKHKENTPISEFTCSFV